MNLKLNLQLLTDLNFKEILTPEKGDYFSGYT